MRKVVATIFLFWLVVGFLFLGGFKDNKVQNIVLGARGPIKIKSKDFRCQDWADICQGKEFLNLYPGWRKEIEIFLKNESETLLRILPRIKNLEGAEKLKENIFLEIKNQDAQFFTGKHPLRWWEKNSNFYLSPAILNSAFEKWILEFEVASTLGNEISNKSSKFDLVFEAYESYER